MAGFQEEKVIYVLFISYIHVKGEEVKDTENLKAIYLIPIHIFNVYQSSV